MDTRSLWVFVDFSLRAHRDFALNNPSALLQEFGGFFLAFWGKVKF